MMIQRTSEFFRRLAIGIGLAGLVFFPTLFLCHGYISVHADTPTLSSPSGGDCQACHKSTMVPADHPKTSSMAMPDCIVCHKQETPSLGNRMPLSHTHLLNGVVCRDCHAEIDPAGYVDKGICMTCHRPQDLVIATRDVRPANPHDSHYGPELDCDLCHHVHASSENFCNQCHAFDFTIPSPIIIP